MYLTISKRFEFCASRKLARRDRNEGQNSKAYGPGANAAYGVGDNFVLYLVFEGPVDDKTGMMMSISVIKERISTLLQERFDHRNLNLDSPPFDKQPPTLELLSQAILNETLPLFNADSARPVACHLVESKGDSCTAYADGRVERHFHLTFSAARRTFAPGLSEKENKALFGKAARQNGHGHTYRLRTTVSGDIHPTFGTIVSYEQAQKALGSFHARLDHRHLNRDVKDLSKVPMTTEIISRYAYAKLSEELPVSRVRLHELDDFFVEYDSAGTTTVAMTTDFQSTHRLASSHLSDEENAALYERCNNVNSHGHRYLVEASASGRIDEETGTLLNLIECQGEIRQALAAYHLRHLDLETEDFSDRPSTGENIIHALWPRVNLALSRNLSRLRLWETPNNRFTLRSNPPQEVNNP